MGIGKYYRRSWKRADGSLVQSPYYTIQFPYLGKTRRESTTATNEREAKACLIRKLEEIGRGEFQPNQDRVTLTELIEHLKAKYQTDDKRSLETALDKLKPVSDYFGRDRRAITIRVAQINQYKSHRLGIGKARATINGELRYLRRLFSVGIEDEILQRAPIVTLLEGENRRDGFVDPGDFETLLSSFQDKDVADMVEFLYITGWRVRVALGLTWNLISYQRGTITMSAELSKNKKPLELPFTGQLKDVIDRRKWARKMECSYVFHRDGMPIASFRRQWIKATKAAGLTGLLVHDLCRSAARNLSRAGVDETVASKYMNRKSLAIFKQYRIVDSDDLARAGAALSQLPQVRKVRSI